MSRWKSFALSVAATLVVASAAATAQQPFKFTGAEAAKYTNNPCASPEISWALWNESAGFNKPTGGADCDPANFGRWVTAVELEASVSAYRTKLKSQGVTYGPLTMAPNGHLEQAITKNGAVLAAFDFGVVAQGAGNIVATGAGNIVATGAGNLIGHDGSSVVAQGAGNFRGVMSAGDTIIQLPGRWLKITKR